MIQKPLLDHGYLTKIETWGSDERIVEAARMSTAKGFLGWRGACLKCHKSPEMASMYDLGPGPMFMPDPGACPADGHDFTYHGDEKLLRYLYENKHATPFEMAGLVIEVQAPIFVFREWHRHRTQSYNEMSSRYVEMEELFYIPSAERLALGGQAKSNKQDSGMQLDFETQRRAALLIEQSCTAAFRAYHTMLAMGLAREIARVVLPVNTYSRMRASANLRNWLAFLTLRTDPKAQYEIRVYAEAVAEVLRGAFPRTMELFDA